nr:hypothetical protein MACL_00002133 [Theileria orientalis]
MKLLALLTLLLIRVNSIDLILPLEDERNDFIIFKSEDHLFKVNFRVCRTKITAYESKTNDIIKRVVFRGVELFKNQMPFQEGSGRCVHHLESEGSDIILVSPSTGPDHMEAIFWFNGNICYNLKYVKKVVTTVEARCPKRYAIDVRRLLYEQLPTVGLPYYDSQQVLNDGKHELEESRIVCDNDRLMVNRMLEALKMTPIQTEEVSSSTGEVRIQAKMKQMIILALIVSEAASVHLKLPVEDNVNDLHAITTKTEMTMEDGTTIDCELGMYESKTKIPITKISIGELDLLNSMTLMTPEFRRLVYDVKINNKELIIVISGSSKMKIEECFLVVDDIMHSLMDLDLGMKDLFGGYNQYSEKIRKLIREILQIIPTNKLINDLCKDLYGFDVSNLPLEGRNIYVPEYQSLRPLEITEEDWEDAGPSHELEPILPLLEEEGTKQK